MKKTLSIILAVAMICSFAIFASANPGQNPNQNPGSPSVTAGALTITVTGGGNNLVIDATFGGETVRVPRLGNGTWTQTSQIVFAKSFTVLSVVINVQGNSLKGFTATVVYACEDVFCSNECADCACGEYYGCASGDDCFFKKGLKEACAPCVPADCILDCECACEGVACDKNLCACECECITEQGGDAPFLCPTCSGNGNVCLTEAHENCFNTKKNSPHPFCFCPCNSGTVCPVEDCKKC